MATDLEQRAITHLKAFLTHLDPEDDERAYNDVEDTISGLEQMLQRVDEANPSALEQRALKILAGAYAEHGQFFDSSADDLFDQIAVCAIVAALQQAQQPGAHAVAWMLRDSRTGKIYWDNEVCVWGCASSANDVADDMNENIDDASFEAFPLYTTPPPLPEGVSEALSYIDFTEDEANEVMDYVLEHGPRLIPTEALQQMRRVLIESARLAARGEKGVQDA